MSAPKRIWAFDYDLQDETGDWKTWQTWTEELPSPFQATEYRRADLLPTDAEVMAHPTVKALVEALERIAKASDHYANEADAENKGAEVLAYAHKSTCNLARAALAAIQEDRR